MAVAYNNQRVVTDGLVLYLDAANSKSYPGSGNTWFDLAGNNDFTIDASGFTYDPTGSFVMSGGGMSRSGTITTATSCTCVFWMNTTDVQSLFLSMGTGGGGYLGAYRVGNKVYHNSVDSPTFFMDTESRPNVYDYIIADDGWHMFEFKSVNLANWSVFRFSQYPSYGFDSGNISCIQIYDRNLTESESSQNFNATRHRYGI